MKDRPAPIPLSEHKERRKKRDIQEIVDVGACAGWWLSWRCWDVHAQTRVCVAGDTPHLYTNAHAMCMGQACVQTRTHHATNSCGTHAQKLLRQQGTQCLRAHTRTQALHHCTTPRVRLQVGKKRGKSEQDVRAGLAELEKLLCAPPNLFKMKAVDYVSA